MPVVNDGTSQKDVVSRLLVIFCECQENGPCCDSIFKSESWDVQQQLMEDSVVGLERFLGDNVARYVG